NRSYIEYALIVNPTIYVSCIKRFWKTVAIKSSNNVTRLQALVDKKKVVVTEAAIKDALHLGNAEGVDCLPNEEIFTELARMGYEKPSIKLTFYKAFFSSQWKFFIHTILQSMSDKHTSWNEFRSTMASAVICLSTVEVVTTAKLITEFVAAISETVSAAVVVPAVVTETVSTVAIVPTVTAAPVKVVIPSIGRRRGVVIRDPEEESSKKTPTETKSKDKGKGIMTKEQIEEEEKRAIASINETRAQKAAKRRRVNEEAEDIEELKQHLEIVPDEDDDVYTEATLLARKVPVVDYQIVHINNKPHFKILKADETHQLHVSFITLLKNFDREDLESLWSIVKERFSTSKPNSFSDDFLLITLRAMFGRLDG
nr:hypothetical protein [Tanacetum cinerariifolium]